MDYFLTHKLYSPISAIEKMMIARMQLFQRHGQPAVYVTRDYNRNVTADLKKFGLDQATYVNMFDYFQGVDQAEYATDEIHLNVIHDHVQSDSPRMQETWYRDNAIVARLRYLPNSRVLDTVTYFDQKGVASSVDLYDSRGWLSMTQFLDSSRNVTAQLFWNLHHELVYAEQYGVLNNGQWGNRSMTLYFNGEIRQFHNMGALFAYFLDQIVLDDSNARFFADRHETSVTSLCELTANVPRFLIMHSSHVLDVQNPNSDLTAWVKKADAAKFSGIVVSTQKQADDLQSRVQIPVFVVPVRYLSNHELNRQREPYRRRAKHTLLVVARLSEEKRIGDVIDAVSLLKESVPDISLNIYGAPMAGYVEQQKLQHQVDDVGLSSCVNFCGFTDNLDELYSHGAVLCVTSRVEGFNVSILEALSYGIPVVTYDINYGPTTLVHDGHNGIVLRQNTPQALAETLQQCFNGYIDMQALSSGAYDSVQAYSAENVWHRWEQVLD
jgi:poly(glycerol-phosphate) alpha-glucosyltransferase